MVFAQHAIQVRKQRGGRVGIASGGCTEQEGGGHGGSRAFAAHVADENALPAIGKDAAKIEIAANVAHGVEGDVDLEGG